MNFIMMGKYVIEHLVGYRPLKEVQLSDSRIQIVKLNSLGTTERVKHLLAISLQV
jgi:hypothetical protein